MLENCYEQKPILYNYRCVSYDFPEYDTEHDVIKMHDYMFLLALSDGLQLVRSENEKYDLPKNSLLFLRRGENFSFINNNGFSVGSFYLTYDYKSLESFVANFRPQKVIKNCFDIKRPLIITLNNTQAAELKKYFLKCYLYISDLEFCNTYGEYLLSYLFINLLTEFKNVKTAGDEISSKPTPPWFSNELSKIVNSNEIYTTTAENIAERMHISTRHLSRLMQKYFGMTTSQYITAIKMKEVANELITTNKKVIDIMSGIGYTNVSWATEQFKAKYGMTPSQYRAEYFK